MYGPTHPLQFAECRSQVRSILDRVCGEDQIKLIVAELLVFDAPTRKATPSNVLAA